MRSTWRRSQRQTDRPVTGFGMLRVLRLMFMVSPLTLIVDWRRTALAPLFTRLRRLLAYGNRQRTYWSLAAMPATHGKGLRSFWRFRWRNLSRAFVQRRKTQRTLAAMPATQSESLQHVMIFTGTCGRPDWRGSPSPFSQTGS